MKNIDDLMRQKFDSDDPAERFEFQEEYWEQAQALLEQEEERRRRWLWLFFALALALALGTWLLLGHPGILSQKEGGVGNSISTTENIENQTNTDGKKAFGERGAQASKVLGDSIGESAARNEAASKKSVVSSSNGTENVNANANGKSSSPNPQRGTKSQESRLDALNTGESRLRQYSSRDATKPDKINKTNNQTTQREDSRQPALAAPQLDSKDAQPTDQNHPEKSETEKQFGILNPASPIPNTPITQYPQIPISNLPTPLAPLDLKPRVLVPKQVQTVVKEPIANQPTPLEDSRFSLGLSLAGAAYEKSDTMGSWAGWTIGAFGAYRLNPKWSLMLGAQWRYVPGHGAFSGPDSDNPDFVEQLRYSFGYKSEQWQRETRGLHYLEVPFSAHWHKARLGLEAGGVVGMLFAVQNRTEHTVSSSLEAAKTTVNKYDKGDKAPYNRQYYSMFAGADYRLNNRISVMTRAQYRFTPVLKKAADGVKNSGLGNLELGLRVRLF